MNTPQPQTNSILVGDIGGTFSRFRLLEPSNGYSRIRHTATWRSTDFGSLEEAIDCYLKQLSRLERARIQSSWLAVAGPVQGNRVQFTNLPWETDAESLEMALRLPQVHLVNDLEALAHAVPSFRNQDVVNVQGEHSKNTGRGLVIAVGTGLGTATWEQTATGIHTHPSEGGHTDFAPLNELHLRLLRDLQADYEHVSYERLLSGDGLSRIYQHLQDPSEPGSDDRTAPTFRSPEQIMLLADREHNVIAQRALHLFSELLGAFAGNAALHAMATAGVLLAGGLCVRLHPYIVSDHFRNAFCAKGRMRPLLESIPVSVASNPDAGLIGMTQLVQNRIDSSGRARAPQTTFPPNAAET